MIHSAKWGLAAASATTCFLSTSALAANVANLGSLSPGEYTVSIPSVLPNSNALSHETSFSLPQDSVLTGWVTGISSGALTLSRTWFDESTGAVVSNQLFRGVVFDGQAVSFGSLAANLAGISPSTYVLQLSGTLASGALPTGAQLKLTVQAVPEPGSWALMGLGLLGVAVAARRRQA